MKHHLTHILMCAAMVVVAAVLVGTGTSVAVLLPVIGCVAMMAVMMVVMGAMAGRGHGDHH